MNKIMIGFLIMSSFSAFAVDYSLECYADIKCPEGSHCAIRELVITVVEGQAQTVTAKSGRRSNEVMRFRTSNEGIVKVSGKDAYGDSFSAQVDLKKVSETGEYSISGKYNVLRVYPLKLECRKL